MNPRIDAHGTLIAFAWVLLPIAVAGLLAMLVAWLNTRFGYGAYSDLERAIIRGRKKRRRA